MSSPFAGYQQGGSYSGSQDRQINGTAMWHKLSGANPIAYDGVIYGGTGTNLSSAVGAGWGVNIAPGVAMVAGYTVVVPAAQSVTHAAATASARRDLIILRVRDVEQGDGVNTAAVEIVQGTTTADPAVPVRSIVLAAVNLRASSGSLIAGDLVDRRTYTAPAGGVVPVTSGTIAANPAFPAGTMFYDIAADIHYRKTSAAITAPLGGLPVTFQGTPMVGPSPPTGKGLVLFAGQEVLNTNPQGDVYALIPGGTFTSTICVSGVAQVDPDTGVGFVAPFRVQSSLTQLAYRAYLLNGNPVVSLPVRINYWALGY